MPSTLAQFRTRIAARLLDAGNTVYSTDTLDEGLLSALHDYSQALPLTAETVLTLPGAGREIALNGIDDLLSVLDVWWPFSSLAEQWPPNQVAGFRVYWDDAQPVLFLHSRTGAQPQADDELRLWYTKPHTIQDLDDGDVTTVFPHHESGLVTGAAGYAVAGQDINQAGAIRLDPNEAVATRQWGAARLKEFADWLATLKTGPGPAGDAYGAGWRLDKWDRP